MIIVTVPQFREALQPLVDARQAQGMRVAVVDVGQVYDSFSYGEPGPEAIRALVEHARTHWTPPAPRYLLLAGDASYDPRGYLEGSEARSGADADCQHRFLRLGRHRTFGTAWRMTAQLLNPSWQSAVSLPKPPSN